MKRRTHSCAGNKYAAWWCNTHINDKSQCSMKYVEDDVLKAAFITMMNKLIYAHRMILKPYVEALRSENKDGSLRRIQQIQTLLLQNSDQRETLTKLMGQGYIDPIIYNEENNALLRQADDYRAEIEMLNKNISGDASHLRRAYSCKHCFAQMVFCGDCGEFFRRVHWNNRGCKSVVWRCVSRLENTGHVCRARTVNEEYLQEVVVQAINQVLCKKDDFLKALQTNIATVIKQGDTLSPEVIDERLRELQKELLKKANQKDDYDAIADEILRLRDMRKQAEVDSVVRDEQMRLIRDLQDFIRQQPTTITGFDETLVKRLITKISVFEDHFTIDFKSGVTIDIKA